MALITFINPATRYKWFNTLWMVAMVMFPILLWLLPSNIMDDTGVDICPSKLFLDIECLGCGMTRAVVHMHHAEWQDAIYYNNAVAVVYPALVGIWCLWMYKAWKRQQRFADRDKKIAV